MSSLPTQPLEFVDFSGGITENILQGDPRRYQAADNLYISVDKKLRSRPGIVPIDNVNYILPSGAQRVNGSYSFINETILMFQSARALYTIDPTSQVWVPILGPSGNAAMSGGDLYSQNTYSEFQRQIFMTNDGTLSQNGILPSRIYRNTSNVWVASTAGLPKAYVQGNYTDSTLLSTCISVANNLRTSMMSHFSDSRYKVYTFTIFDQGDAVNLHVNFDKYSMSYFTTQTFNANTDAEVPAVIPTPAGAAVDQASLFLLIAAMNNAYTHHMQDSMKDSSSAQAQSPFPFYHADAQIDPIAGPFTATPRGPGATLANNTTPTTLIQAAAMIDDLTQKWFWHRFALFTHSPSNDPVQMNRYGFGLTKIGTVLQGNSYATITPDLSDVYGYVNNLQFLYNSHVKNRDIFGTGNIAHIQPDNYYALGNFALQVNLPPCYDFDSFCLNVFWLRNMYAMHTLDEKVAIHRNITFNCTAGSATLSSVALPVLGSSVTIPVGAWIVSDPTTKGTQTGTAFQNVVNGVQTSGFFGTFGQTFCARVIASSSGSATLDRPTLSTVSGATGQYALARYHLSSQNTTNSQFLDTTVSVAQAANSLTTDYRSLGGSSYASWLTLANEMFFALANHALYLPTHFQPRYFALEWTNLLSSVPTKPFFIPTVASFAYAFFFSEKYTVEPNGIQYLVQGNPIFSSSISSGVSYPIGTSIASQNTTFYPAASTLTQRANQLTNLPVLTNDSNTNYDTANIMLNIYRTTDGGNSYYLLAQVPNGTTSYSDITNDTLANPGSKSLGANQPIYTSGGVVGSDQPPQAKFTHTLAGTTYWAGITDSGQYFPQRLRQSLTAAPEWAPATFFDDMDDDITGLSSTRANLLVFCKNSIYRESGGFNNLGQGALTHDKISDSLGCQNAKSIIRTEIGVFFAGNDGFYYTDGFQIINITLELKKTYALLTQTPAQVRSIYGAYDKLTRRIFWAMKTSPTDTDNSVFFVYYLDYGVKPSGTFTTVSSTSYMRPSSAVFQQGTLYYGHELGYVLKLDPNTKTDVQIDPTKTASNWNKTVIPYNFVSMAVDCGTTYRRKYLTKLHVTGKNYGNQAIQPWVIRDLNSTQAGPKAMAPINYVGNLTWGNPVCIWGDKTQKWEYDGTMDVMRRFPASTLRSDFVQVQFLPNANAAVYVSSVNFPVGANAQVDATAKLAVILTPSTYTQVVWPLDVVNMYISFSIDGYKNQYLITALSGSNGITFSDPNNTAISNFSGGYQWQITGTKKEQAFSLTSFVMHFAFLGDSVQDYGGKASNGGAGNAGFNP